MGVAYSGKCYPTATDAYNKFLQAFPLVDGTAIATLTSSSLAGSTVTYSISHRPLSGTTATVRTGTVALPPCAMEAGDKFADLAVQDILVAIGMAVCFLIGLIAGKVR